MRFGIGASVFSQSNINGGSNVDYYGIRTLVTSGYAGKTPSIMTSRGYLDPNARPNYTNPNFNAVKGRYEEGTFRAPSAKTFIVCGIARWHTTTLTDDPVFWEFSPYFETDSLYIQDLLSLPYFRPTAEGGLGNTPVSTTDRDALTLQIYQAGMYIVRDGMLPPINELCTLNYQFDYADTWEGSSDIFDWGTFTPGSGNNGVLNGTNLGWQNWTIPWEGVIDLNGGAYITVANNFMSANTEATQEWIGQRTGTGSRYISDARAGTGTWFLTNYQGYEYNFNANLQANGSTWGVTNAPQQKHWGMVTLSSTLNQSNLYWGSILGYYGMVQQGSCNTSMPRIGTDFHIGARYTNSSIWPGEFAMYRVWDVKLSATQAEICYRHEGGRVGYGTEL